MEGEPMKADRLPVLCTLESIKHSARARGVALQVIDEWAYFYLLWIARAENSPKGSAREVLLDLKNLQIVRPSRSCSSARMSAWPPTTPIWGSAGR